MFPEKFNTKTLSPFVMGLLARGEPGFCTIVHSPHKPMHELVDQFVARETDGSLSQEAVGFIACLSGLHQMLPSPGQPRAEKLITPLHVSLAAP